MKTLATVTKPSAGNQGKLLEVAILLGLKKQLILLRH